jgi:uncharacterized protein YdeI (BOF family)
MKRFTLLGLCSLTIVAAVSCGASFNQDLGAGLRHWLSEATGFKQLEPVTDITAAQDLAAGEEVSLAGQVMQHLPLIEQTLYQLEDDTGAIWVLSAQSPPPVGTPLTIRAVVRYKSILMAGQDIGEHYAEELERYPQDD